MHSSHGELGIHGKSLEKPPRRVQRSNARLAVARCIEKERIEIALP